MNAANCVSVDGKVHPSVDVAVESEASVFFTLTQRVIPQMLSRVESVAAATRSLAIEYASRGIRVNAVSPAVIQTPMHLPESYDRLAGFVPLGRVGQIR